MIFHVRSACWHMKKRLDFKHFLSRKTGVQLFGSSDRLHSRFFCLYSLLGLYGTEWIAAARRDPEAYPMEATGKYISSVHLIIVFFMRTCYIAKII